MQFNNTFNLENKSNIKDINENNKLEQSTFVFPPKFISKEHAELYMQQIVNFYDSNPKFDF